MELDSIRFQNFKGFTEKKITFAGVNADIYGANKTKKTTIFDGFIWLLFNMDSLGQGDKIYNVKPIDPITEKVIHGLETVVEAVLFHDGERIILKKVLTENWVMSSGKTEAVFSGNECQHYLDGDPVQKTEYDNRIKEFVEINAFKLLTNPLYAINQIHWTELRKLLFEILGDVTSSEVINSNPLLSGFAEKLGDREIEKYQSILKTEKSELNKELAKVPVKITEAQASIPDVYNIDFEATAAARLAQISIGEDIAAKLLDLKNGSLVGAHKVKKLDIEQKIAQLEIKARGDFSTKQWSIKEKRSATKAEIKNCKSFQTGMQIDIDMCKTRIRDWTAQADLERKAHAELLEQEFHCDIPEVCQTCGQQLPFEKVSETRDRAEKQFNLDKSERLEKLKKHVVEVITPAIEKLELEKKDNEKELADNLQIETELRTRLNLEDDALAELIDPATVYTANPIYTGLIKSRDESSEKIKDIESSGTAENDRLSALKRESDLEVNRLNTVFARKEQLEKAQARIKMHTADGRNLAAQIEDIDENLNLCDIFIETKVDLLEDLINSRFVMTKFKLFTTHIKGGHDSCCEITHEGVPYRTMNHAARINCGLDLINLFSIYYDFTAPVFVDNAESVDECIKMNAQVIRLIDSKEDKILRVEQGV